jgi:hypothetical protein
MSDNFEEIRKQIHEIRNLSAPFGLELANLKEQMAQERSLFEEKLAQIESMILNNSFKIGDLLEKVKRMESKSKIPPESERKTPPQQSPGQ